MRAKRRRRMLDARRKKRRPEGEQAEATAPRRTLSGSDGEDGERSVTRRGEARPHHYFFAHRVLRDNFFKTTRELTAALLVDREDFLHAMWDEVGDVIAEHEGEPARLSPEGLALTVREIDSHTVVLIVTMPSAKYQTEALFVGMIVGPEGLARYVTLERAHRLLGPETGVHLCRWFANGGHAMMRDSPEPTLDAFADEIAKMAKH